MVRHVMSNITSLNIKKIYIMEIFHKTSGVITLSKLTMRNKSLANEISLQKV